MRKNQLEKQFIKAYDQYSDAIFRYCLYRVYNRETAQDIAQEAYTRTWNYLVCGNKIDNLRAFLYRTARNLIIDASRRQTSDSLEKLQEESGFEPAVAAPQICETELGEVFDKLDQIDVEHREALILRHVEGYSPKEIAAITGESENTVSVRVHRAQQKLKQLLNHG